MDDDDRLVLFMTSALSGMLAGSVAGPVTLDHLSNPKMRTLLALRARQLADAMLLAYEQEPT